jgi:hypothetical protein
MAVIQALRHTHPSDPVTVYIDNTGVVQTTQKWTDDDPRARLKQGGRAIWNRIQGMEAARLYWGGETTYKWIHSHVDKVERRQWKKEWAHKCACGGGGIGMCEPRHWHHQGNEEADEAATEGLNMERPTEAQLQCTFGEETWHLHHKGAVLQSHVGDSMTKELQRIRVKEMRERATKENLSKAQAWLSRREESDPSVVAFLAKDPKNSVRFTIRAWTGTLCTYKEEAKKAEKLGTKNEVYGDLLQGGRCRCCSKGVVEDEAHVWSCPGRQQIRDDFWRLQEAEVDDENADELEAAKQGWGQEMEGTEWQPWWASLGMVPKKVMLRLENDRAHSARAMLKNLARERLRLAKEMWDKRNETTLEWEKQKGIKDKKTAAAKRGWTFVGPRLGRRGRPRRAQEDLTSAAYVESRVRKDEKARLCSIFGVREGEERYAKWSKIRTARKRQESRLARAKGEGAGTDVTPWTTKTTVRFTQKKQPGAVMSKRLRQNQRRAEPACGACAVAGCDEPGTTTGRTCTRGERRCSNHRLIPCIGGLTACKCKLEREGTVGGRSRTEELRIRRGTVIRLKTDEEGVEDPWIEGTVRSITYAKRKPGVRYGQEHRKYEVDVREGQGAHMRADAPPIELWTVTTATLRRGGGWIIRDPADS